MKKQQRIRRAGIAVLAGLAVTGIVGASAASLGGIDDRTLGADVADVGSCDTDGVTVAYDASYDADAGVVELDEATIGGVSTDCNTLTYEVTVTDAADAVLGQETGTVVVTVLDPSFTVDFREDPLDPLADGVDAEAVVGIAITIFGS